MVANAAGAAMIVESSEVAEIAKVAKVAEIAEVPMTAEIELVFLPKTFEDLVCFQILYGFYETKFSFCQNS